MKESVPCLPHDAVFLLHPIVLKAVAKYILEFGWKPYDWVRESVYFRWGVQLSDDLICILYCKAKYKEL